MKAARLIESIGAVLIQVAHGELGTDAIDVPATNGNNVEVAVGPDLEVGDRTEVEAPANTVSLGDVVGDFVGHAARENEAGAGRVHVVAVEISVVIVADEAGVADAGGESRRVQKANGGRGDRADPTEFGIDVRMPGTMSRLETFCGLSSRGP